jgi:hypothetical protein
MRGKLQAAAGVAAALLAVPGTAYAQGSYGDFSLDFGTTATGAEAKPKLVVAYRNPDDPNGKPPAIASAVFRLPEGTRIDTAAVERCTATNDQIQASGPSACPPGSKVGAGKLTAVTGFGPPTDPVAGDVTVFNGADELIEVVTVPGTQTVAGMDRLSVEGHVLTAHPPAIPGGPPDGRTAVKDIQLTIDRSGYVTTPPECEVPGWAYGASYEFANGAKQEVSHRHDCKPAHGVPSNAMGIRPSPSRITAGRRTKVIFRVASPSAACRNGAKIRFAGRRKLASPNGRASFTVTLHGLGRHAVNVSKRGCRTARGFVTVLRR